LSGPSWGHEAIPRGVSTFVRSIYSMNIGTRSSGSPFTLSDEDQGQHAVLIGGTGTGKSVLLSNMAAPLLERGDGVCLIDPHGSLADNFLKLIPPHRHRDVVFLNMADLERPIGLPFITDIPPEKRFKVAEDIVATFVHIWGKEAVGDRSQMVLRNALRAVMDDGGTLLSVPKFLKNIRYRKKVLLAVEDDYVHFNWTEVLGDHSKGKEDDVVSPILNKFDAILVPPLRNIFSQRMATIDIGRMMDEGRILIVSLQKGMIGELPARFLGSMVMAHINTKAFERAPLLKEGKPVKPFYVFADEFHNFVSDDFDIVLAEARKYGLHLRLAAQFLDQFSRRLQQSVLVNCATTVVFRCGSEDAERLAKQLSWSNPDYLHGLPDYVAMGRFLVKDKHNVGHIRGPLELKTHPPPPQINDRVQEMIADSRTRFGRDREVVEQKISAFLQSYPKIKRKQPPATWEA
jgi:hypothetical protein